MNTRTVAASLVIAALVGAGVTLAVQALFFDSGGESLPAAGQLSQSWLEGIDINKLADQGMYLSQPPPDYFPKFSGAYAKDVADDTYNHAPARQILLAHLQTASLGGFDGQVYVVNFDPKEVPAECPGSHTVYAVAFVDADTARVLSEQSEESPPPTPCHGVPVLQSPTPTLAAQVTP